MRTSAAKRHNAIALVLKVCGDSIVNILVSGIRFRAVKDGRFQARTVDHLLDLVGHAEFHQSRIGNNEKICSAESLRLCARFL